MRKKIPLNDLARIHSPIRAELDRAVARVLDSGWFLRGREVTAFEDEWADYCGQKYCVACNSGTDALTIAALALRMSEANVQANTLSLTATGLYRAGVQINVVDIEPDGRINRDTENAVPVLLFGRYPTQSETRHTLFDAAHSHGWTPPSHATACWSFYPSKTLGALGDAGAVTSNDFDVAEMMRDLTGRDDQLRDGRQITSRMDEMQAAVLRVKLKHLPSWIEARRQIGAWYIENLPPNVQMVATAKADLHHLAVVRVDKRDELKAYLQSQGVETKIHFQNPLHRQQAPWGNKSARLPLAEQWCDSVLTLPCFPDMTTTELTRVKNLIEGFFEKSHPRSNLKTPANLTLP